MLKLAVFAVLAIAVVTLAWVSAAIWRLSAAIEADKARMLAAAHPAGLVVTEAMLAALPEPARRYLRYAGVVGKPVPAVVRLTQAGRIRGAVDAKWMNLEAEETYTTDPPGFLWRAWFPKRTMPFVMGRDEYAGGEGSILMKMAGVVTVADEHGPELGPAGLMRYLNEMMWFPAAFLGRNVDLAPVDEGTFTATIIDGDTTATATLFVDAEGRLTNFRAVRYNTGSRSMETWETPIRGYSEYGGYRLPSRGEGVWKQPGGDFSYIDLDILTVTYDAQSP